MFRNHKLRKSIKSLQIPEIRRNSKNLGYLENLEILPILENLKYLKKSMGIPEISEISEISEIPSKSRFIEKSQQSVKSRSNHFFSFGFLPSQLGVNPEFLTVPGNGQWSIIWNLSENKRVGCSRMNIWPARIVLIATLDPWLFLNFIGFRFFVLFLGEKFGNPSHIHQVTWPECDFYKTSPNFQIRDHFPHL